MSDDALINGLAGAGGGIIAQLLTYPLQTVNTRQQTERDPAKAGNNNDGAFRQMRKVVKNEGWGRLYGGLAPSLVGTTVSQGVYYYFYQIFRNRAEVSAIKRQMEGKGDGSIGVFESLIVAALAGCTNVLLTNPIWLVVTRMQAHKITRKRQSPNAQSSVPGENFDAVADELSFGISHVVQELYDEAGLWGFWKGVVPALIMVSNPSMQFMFYENLLKKLKKARGLKGKGAEGLTAIEIFLLGAVAKLGATVITYPLLVVKSRLQVKQGAGASGDKRHHYKGTYDAITKMIRYDGASAFYKGMSTKIVQSVFAAAVLFMVKEELVKAAQLLVTGGLKVTSKSKPKSL